MTEIKKVPARSEVSEKLTWDLDRVYQSIEDWKTDQRKLENKLDEFKHAKDQLEINADKFLEVIEQYLGIMRIYEKLAVFASMKNDQDTTNSQYQELQGMADNLGTQVSEAVAWFQPALVHLDDQVVQDYFPLQQPGTLDLHHLTFQMFFRELQKCSPLQPITLLAHYLTNARAVNAIQ